MKTALPGVPPTHTDERFMARALRLAARGLGETNPNPVVGCVVVREGRVVGEGHHARAGGPHAEVVALARAGARARGSTLYVTLEPCAHQGRTPPCVPQILSAGVRRVVAALPDPDPRVDGRGLSRLRRAGLQVTTGVLGVEALLLNERFVVSARAGRPFVLLKSGLTLDGRLATANGESKWITSPAQRRQARSLRRLHDAVLVGIGTVLADDPLLLPVPGVKRPFLRVVLDSHLRLPPAGRLVRSARRFPLLVLCREADPGRRRRLEARGVRVVSQPGARSRVSLPWALATLWTRGIRSLMVEGGSEVLGAFLAARSVDAVALFRAPLLLGGRHGRPAFGGPDPTRLRQALRLSPESPLRRGRTVDPSLPGPWPEPRLFELWYPRREGARD
ncbi:MAG TPA: bifunctional diaminohydroxyphosphoribosylaminopyrimidine deaminase/5-amino-6-(5-phosphoribosylamino)uracil reductase RibD [Vicinamibacteria bacterium]|jgi:diaminohydroxyphosphoribosylaminopyrimidine deaminase/5-amino-6-(5-phosphoribosylamino)uracil reductase|nr:bifunctional diaminohydroxyphosphoribosylaminopyrimidine deaminase/5-amino-6-(5-phosphoribosylamino)uracil reductase RibD [Vicinamibacteria bacterium]